MENESEHITITHSKTREKRRISQKLASEGHKTMGVFMDPLGKFADEHKYLRGKSSTFAIKMSATALKQREALEVFLRMFWSSLTYSSSIPTVTPKQANWIESPALCATLKKMGFEASTSQAVVWGDRDYGGVGMPSYFCEQGVAKVLRATAHVRDYSEARKLFLVGLSHWRTTAGTAKCPLLDHRDMPHLDFGWLTAVRNFLRYIGVKIHFPGLPTYAKPRLHDVNIMEAFMDVYTSAAQLRAVNRVRLYLRAHWLSDISNGAGTHILQNYMSRAAPRIPTRLHWPNQGCQSISDWSIWRTLLYKATLEDKSGKLEVPLGP